MLNTGGALNYSNFGTTIFVGDLRSNYGRRYCDKLRSPIFFCIDCDNCVFTWVSVLFIMFMNPYAIEVIWFACIPTPSGCTKRFWCTCSFRLGFFVKSVFNFSLKTSVPMFLISSLSFVCYPFLPFGSYLLGFYSFSKSSPYESSYSRIFYCLGRFFLGEILFFTLSVSSYSGSYWHFL
jgi:hypothetical protein